MDDVLAAGLAGLIAGIAVAMPLGAIGVLLVNEGMTAGWRPAAAGAAGVAFVDVAYAGLAVAAGASLSRALLGWERAIHIGGAVLLVGIAVRGLTAILSWDRGWDRVRDRVRAVLPGLARPVVNEMPAPAPSGRPVVREVPAPVPVGPAVVPPWKVCARFVGLTALNPLTAVYFVALAAGLGTTLTGWDRAVAFVLAVFAASLAWQLILVTFGAIAGARLPPGARTVTGLAGYVVVLAYAVRLALS